MYKLTTSQIQNFLTTDFMPVVVNANAPAVRGILVVMVTSGGANYPNGTFYTKVRGDGDGNAIGVNKQNWRLFDYNFNLTLFEERYNVLSFVNGNCGLLYAK